MKVLKGTPAELETFIQTLEQMAWEIFPVIGRTVIEDAGVKYLVNRHRGSDHDTKTFLRYAEVTHDVAQNVYWLPDALQKGCEQEYLDLIQDEIDKSGLTEDDNFTPTQPPEEIE